MATANPQQPITVEDYIRVHSDSNPSDLLKLLMQRDRIPMNSDGTFAPRTLEDVWRIGDLYSRSELVPESYRGKPANCAVAVEYAQQLGVPPLFFMQQSFVVRGRPAISAQLMIALLNKSKRLKTALHYTTGGEGKSRWWTATARDASTNEEVSFTVTWEMVEAEGWDKSRGESKQQSKWVTMADLMGRYRAASYLIKTHYPDVLMGLVEESEARDMTTPEPVAQISQKESGKAMTLDDLTAALAKETSTSKREDSDLFGKMETTTTTPDKPTLTDDQTFGWDVWLEQLRECSTKAKLDALGIPKVFSAAQEAAALKLIAAQSSTLKGDK